MIRLVAAAAAVAVVLFAVYPLLVLAYQLSAGEEIFSVKYSQVIRDGKLYVNVTVTYSGAAPAEITGLGVGGNETSCSGTTCSLVYGPVTDYAGVPEMTLHLIVGGIYPVEVRVSG